MAISNATRTMMNAAIIYVQRFSSAALSFVTTPLVLRSLGVEDFGLYTLCIGFVGMLSFLGWSLSSATQRYISVAQGRNQIEEVRKVFSTAVAIHFFYGIGLVFVVACAGFFFSNSLLNIPPQRENDSGLLLLITGSLTFFATLSIPFVGILRANENFSMIAFVGVSESVLKLLVAYLLQFSRSDNLLLYSALLSFIAAVVLVSYVIVVRRLYPSSSFSASQVNAQSFKDMLSFISWNFLGAVAVISRNQGVVVLLNIFFGVIKNAAYGIALQVGSALGILSQGIIGSMTPQIAKSAGAGNNDRMIFLMRTMSKFAFFSIAIVGIPLAFYTRQLLELWLGKSVPLDTEIYVQLTIVFGLIMLLSAGIQTVFDAVGKVKLYNSYVSGILMLNLPIGYLLFKLDFGSPTIIIVGMALEIITLFVRLRLLRKYIQYPVSDVLYDILLRTIAPVIIVTVIFAVYRNAAGETFAAVIGCFILSLIIFPFVIYRIGLEPTQRVILDEMFAGIKKRLR